MLIKKVLQTEIDISDCIGLYAGGNVENNIKNILIGMFTGRCYRKCFVVEVLKIIEYGACTINQEGSADSGTMPVRFEVSALVYTPGEILNGCTVVNREENGNIICSQEQTDIILSANPLINSIQISQKISVRVHRSKYTIGNAKISVSAVPLLPSKSPVQYHYKPAGLGPDFQKYLESLLEQIDDALAIASENKKKPAYKFFEMLLFAYNDSPKLAEPNMYTDLLEFVKNPPTVEFYVCRDPRLMPTSQKIYIGDSAGLLRDDVKVVMDQPAEVVLTALLDDYYNNIRTVNEMIKIYDKQATLNAHTNLWAIFGAVKRTP